MFDWTIGLGNLIFNDHSWYHLNTMGDFTRCFLWILINTVTAFSYFLIPKEMWIWRKALPSEFKTPGLIVTAFVGFICFCGLHHLIDIAVMPTAPWWSIALNIPMAVFSVATAMYLHKLREPIKNFLTSLGGLFGTAKT